MQTIENLFYAIEMNCICKINLKKKKYDVGMCIKPKIYDVPKPSKEDYRISWLGSNWFGHGIREETGKLYS